MCLDGSHPRNAQLRNGYKKEKNSFFLRCHSRGREAKQEQEWKCFSSMPNRFWLHKSSFESIL